MNYSIRELKRDENKILDTFLYEAIFIPEGVPVPSKDIINKPDLQVYVKDFGENKGDLCLVAQVADENDYGHIDNETPSFAISLLKEYRNYGIGTELMKQMLMKLKLEGYKQASLAVQKMNYAVRMYRKVGFEIVDENDEEYIMICKLQELSISSLSDSYKILCGLGRMYVGGGELTENIDDVGGAGTAEFASKAIDIFYMSKK